MVSQATPFAERSRLGRVWLARLTHPQVVKMARRMRRQVFQSDPDLQQFVLPEVRPTGRQLGVGSYGSVEELEMNGLVCAGKRIHDALLEQGNIGATNIARKYLEECQVMAKMRHPHVVQFLGLCFLEGSALPVLVMERLDSSLDELLEDAPGLPLALKRSLLADVARGLLYLHTRNPPVVHRDLSAKNVLLTSSLVAKISDLGNARIVDLRPGQLARTLTHLPGTQSYMPPEALIEGSRYGPRLDIFSFGHLALFTLTQVFPGSLLPPNFPDPDNPDHLIGRSEVERRREYIQQLHVQLPEQHPLVQLVHQCLHNTPARRPSAEELLQQLEAVRDQIEGGPYGQLVSVNMEKLRMVRTLREKDTEIGQLQQQMQQLEVEVEAKDNQLQQQSTQLRERNNQIDRQQREQGVLRDDKRRLQVEVEEKDTQLQRQEAELQEKAMQLSRLQRELQTLRARNAQQATALQEKDTEINRLQREPKACPPPELQLPLRLRWKQHKSLPFGMSVSYSVVAQGRVYMGGGGASKDEDQHTVMVYEQGAGWRTLPRYQYKYFAMAVLQDQLTLVGGCESSTGMATNQIAVWDSRQWTHPYPSMPTPRRTPAVVTYIKCLVVAGGEDGGGIHPLSTVEIMDTTNKQWFTTIPLPVKWRNMRSAIVGEECYFMGGFTDKSVPNKQAFHVSISAITSQGPSQSGIIPVQWHTFPDTPLECSAVLALRGSLLAVGGRHISDDPSSAIHLYQPESGQWVKVGDLPTARNACSCTLLPSGEILVAGGYNKQGSSSYYISRVDVASLD